MKKFLFAVSLSALIPAAGFAQEGDIIQPQYSSMSCLQIVDQLNAASEVLGGAPERGLISTNTAIGVASNAGQRFAVNSGNGEIATGIAIAGRILGSANRRREQEAAALRERETRRWYYLSGIYDGRRCDNLIPGELAAQELLARDDEE